MARKGKAGKKIKLSDLKVTKGGSVKGGSLKGAPLQSRLNK